MSNFPITIKFDSSEMKQLNKAILGSATTHSDKGLAVHWLKMGSKIPATAGWNNTAVLTVSDLLKTHQPGFNVGFRAGKFSDIGGCDLVVLDIDIKHPNFADEAYAAANQLMDGKFQPTVISGSLVGRHQYLFVPKGMAPDKAATTLRQSDVAVKDGLTVPIGTEGGKPAWTIELLSTGKNVVMPPSIHPDTYMQYAWANGVDMGDVAHMPDSMLNMLKDLNGLSWPEPEQIRFDLLPVAKFSPELLPEVLRKFVYDITDRTQCPVDFVGVIVVQMLCVLIGNSCAIRPKQLDDWFELPNLWAAIVGRPGQLKTPAKNKGFEPLKFLEWEAQTAHEAEMAFFENAKIDKELEIQRLKNIKIRSATQQKELSDLLKNKPAEPHLRRYRSSDATVEKLGDLLNKNPRGLLIERDELAGLLAGFEKSGHESDRAFYLEGWNGHGRYIVDRIGRGTTIVENMTLSVFGSIQPAKLQRYLHEAQYGMGNDGLLQRFQLFVYPDDNPVWSIVDREPNREALDAVISLCRKLSTEPWITLGAQTGAHPLPFFRFDLEAQKIFNDWFINLGKQVANEENSLVAEHLGKYRKLVPALSLVFHLIDISTAVVPAGTCITIASINRAIAWAAYLESHARRIYQMGIDIRQDAVNSLMKRILSGDLKDGFTERDIYRNKWSNLTDPELVSAACTELEQANWIRRKQRERSGPGRTKITYEINPSIDS